MIDSLLTQEDRLETGRVAQLAMLADAGREDDAQRFVAILEECDWEAFAADEMVEILRTALNLQLFLLARRLSAAGAEIYPEHAELAKFARILAPPVTKIAPLPFKVDILANKNWLIQHRESYNGKWVAIKDGELLANAETVDELLQITGNVRNKGILITKVL